MFSVECNQETINQIACLNGFPQSNDHPLLSLETLFAAVDLANGAIFGSIIHKYLSGLSYKTKDVDILVPSLHDMETLKMHMAKAAQEAKQNDSKFDFYLDRSFCNVNDVYGFLFSNTVTKLTRNRWGMIPILKSNSLRIQIKMKDTVAMVINIIAVNNHSNLLEKMHTTILKKDFLCNFYYRGKIYHKLDNVRSVKISHTMLKDRDYMHQIRKYTMRGVEFSIQDQSELLKADKSIYDAAKKTYKSKGLVVLPLVRSDNDMAGKAVAISNWKELTKDYNFKMTKDIDNIGILCGPGSGIVCIDVDVKDRGVEMFQKMLSIYGDLPESCPIQRTGNGGYHYIFKYDHTRMANMKAKIKCPKLGKRPIGIDMWIQECQFVVSPSVNYATGIQYTWTKPIGKIKDIPDMPEWIYQLYNQEVIDEDGHILSDDLGETKIDMIKDITYPEVIVVADPIEVTNLESVPRSMVAYKCMGCLLILIALISMILLMVFKK